jgi:hypothetical protein
LGEAAALARAIREHEGGRMAEVNAALAWVFGGRLGAARRALDGGQRGDDALARPKALEAQARAELWLETGAFALAREEFDRCEALAEQSGDRRRATHARLERAFAARSFDDCLRGVERALAQPEYTRDVAALSWLELGLVAPSAQDALEMARRASACEAPLGPVATLLEALVRLRAGGDPSDSLEAALDHAETVFVVLGWRMVFERSPEDSARRANAAQRYARAFEEASDGLDRESIERWRRGIALRASRDLGAPWSPSAER